MSTKLTENNLFDQARTTSLYSLTTYKFASFFFYGVPATPPPMSCLGDSPVDWDVLPLRKAIRRLVAEAKTTHSVDGYLILLGGLVFEIEDLGGLRAADYNPREVLRKVLSCAEVAEALSPLANYVEAVRSLVNSGPRHRSLRPYIDLIVEAVRAVPPSERELEILRPPLSVLELEEAPGAGPQPRTRGYPELRPPRVLEEAPGARLETGSHAPHHAPVGAAGLSAPVKNRRGAIKRVLGYASLTILLAGIGYLAYALLVKYGLIRPMQHIPLP